MSVAKKRSFDSRKFDDNANQMQAQGVKWGSHRSMPKQIADLISTCIADGHQAVQIFFGPEDGYSRHKMSEPDRKRSAQLIKDHDFRFNTHFPYWMNLCKKDARVDILQAEMNRIGEIGGHVVVHTGSCTSCSVANKEVNAKASAIKLATWTSGWQEGADNLIEHLNSLNGTRALLLEPPAGEGKKLGWKLEQIRYVFDRCPNDVGFCLDTCHAFAAGASTFQSAEAVRTFFNQLGEALGGGDREAGWLRLKLIHLNDSKDPFGSLKDRHAPLAHGFIWQDDAHVEGLIELWQFCREHNVAVVSEVGSQQDLDIMRALDSSD